MSPSLKWICTMEDISCSHAFGRKPHCYWIYTVRTAKTPSQWAIP